MENLFLFSLEELPFIIIALVIGFTIHEFAHAYLANKFGDPTAKQQGRLTLSPMAHIDPIGALLILIFGFGWAKPVPVNSSYFKNRRLASIIVSLGGPLSNFLVAIISVFIWYLLITTGVTSSLSDTWNEFLFQLFNTVTYLNVLLLIFNLLPLPPLDGYRVIEELAPRRIQQKMRKFEGYGIFIFLLIVFTPLNNYILQPILNLIDNVIYFLDFVVSYLLF